MGSNISGLSSSAAVGIVLAVIIVAAVGVGVYVFNGTATTPASSPSSSSSSSNAPESIPLGGFVSSSSSTTSQCEVIGHVEYTIPTHNATLAALAYDPHVNELYATGQSFTYFGPGQSNYTYSIDPSNSGKITRIANTALPTDILYDPDNNNLYVTNFGSNTVSIINDTTNTITGSIAVGRGPIRIAYDPSNHEIYVSNRISGTVSVINASLNRTVANVSVSASPFGMVYDALSHAIYVTDGVTSRVTIIDGTTNRVVSTFSAGQGSGMIAYDSANTYLYFFPQTSGTLYLINSTTNKIIGNISGMADLNALAYDRQSHNIYAAGNASGGSLNVITGQDRNATVVASIVGYDWIPVDFAFSNGTMYMSSNYDSKLYALSSGGPSGVCQNNQGTVTNEGGGGIGTTVINNQYAG